jgi:hypothetical protein
MKLFVHIVNTITLYFNILLLLADVLNGKTTGSEFVLKILEEIIDCFYIIKVH